ncbi:molybdate ABC transporter permease subunit [Reichenbachiella agariperforans]|uniref:molybdate ABC transporter permease subunit n=1 Tax=Reichenbachiella agariperforans TaxID=156994 RepID=UPI001C0A0990|nr:molybdate ABC transporter permease subunit [Reichenbachiella agariperforans]MBU2913182.1 molybdate ABC transporter permease subunit [Reichenbachiella agariperforans]
MEEFWHPLLLSGKLAIYTTAILFLVIAPILYVLSMYHFIGKKLIKAIVALPLILPPSVLGFYLLLAFSPSGIIGQAWNQVFNTRLAFSFQGILIASVIFSFPFMINPILSAIEGLPITLTQASYSLGKSRWHTFVRVLLPNVKPSILSACVLTFAHTIGEFGVILMIGGNIPKETRVASMAIYHQLEMMNYDIANQYAIILVIFSFVVLLGLQLLQKNPTRPILC